MTELSALFKQVRIGAGLTQGQAAKIIGAAGPAAISHYENGERRVPIAALERLIQHAGGRLTIQADNVTPARLTISVETLSHFQCPYCQKWWSIGDAPRRAVWYCPWCGMQSEAADE